MNRTHQSESSFAGSLFQRRHLLIAVVAAAGIAANLILRFGAPGYSRFQILPLYAVFVFGGVPLTLELLVKLVRREFGSDLLAGIAIVTSVLLQEYLAGALVVLMLSGGAALESFAIQNASKALDALVQRMPNFAHRRESGQLVEIDPSAIQVGDTLEIFPHEVSPVDGTVIAGHGSMDESYLTGEPYALSKTPGSAVLSGAINGDGPLTIRVEQIPTESRYAKIIEVMRSSEEQRPRIRRLGDKLGALYTPIALIIAIAAWIVSGDSVRFLAVLVVATPCPLLVAIPVAIIGAVSVAARRGIIIRNPAALEQLRNCHTVIFDKTGTLTYGVPQLVNVTTAAGFNVAEVLALAASLERYSKHPLATAVLKDAQQRGLQLAEAAEISERPGQGLRGSIAGSNVAIVGRKHLAELDPNAAAELPTSGAGLECVVVINDKYAGVLRFRDEPRAEGPSVIAHLLPKHAVQRLMIVSGDRESEVKYLADRVGIENVYASQSPEQKLEIVRRETAEGKTVYLGDGINDAPALAAATIGIAFGKDCNVSTEAADAVILESSLAAFDAFLHIATRMRRIALQSAIGGMMLSGFGMIAAALGYLSPVAGAILQEAIDVAAVLNALRMVLPVRTLTDY